MIPHTLTLTAAQHRDLQKHLFPGDNKEAVAILLCGRRNGDRRHRLTVRDVFVIPHDECVLREVDKVIWSPDYIVPHLEEATTKELSVIKVHSHPTGYPEFSKTDDEGDNRLLPMIKGWVEHDIAHGSAVMLPDGTMFGRVIVNDDTMQPLECINVVGDDLRFWYQNSGDTKTPDFMASHAQAFDEGTIERLQKMSVAVVGCSGTGSPAIEQLMRLGVGELVLVDFDTVEERNVNRILNSTMEDARLKRPKVDVLADAIKKTGLGTKVIKLKTNLWDTEVVRAIGQCDVIFGCMDTVDGRYLLNSLATHYLIPYFDIGIRLDTYREGPKTGTIREVCGTVNYLQPGLSSLMSRGLFSMEAVRAAGLERKDPSAHQRQMNEGYIAGVTNHRPAVISVNMFASSLAVNEFLARLHPYREYPNEYFASVQFSLASMELIMDPEESICEILERRVGFGDTKPLLGEMELAERRI
jgi:proteasome lid subunit RPN8/RPN11